MFRPMAKTAFPGASRKTEFMLDPRPPAEGGECTIIGLDTDDGPEHDRYDCRIEDKSVDEDMVQGMMKHGVIQAIVVERSKEQPELGAIVVAGRRRVRHLRIANDRLVKLGMEPLRIPVVLRRGDEHEMLAVQAIENEHRRASSPVERARMMLRLANAEMSYKEIGQKFAVTATTVRNHLNLLEMDRSVHTAVDGGKLSMTSALMMKDLSKAEQKKKVKEMCAPTKAAHEGEPPADGKNKPARMPPKKRKKGKTTVKEAAAAAGKHVRPGLKALKRLVEVGDDGKAPLGDLKATDFINWYLGRTEMPEQVKAVIG